LHKLKIKAMLKFRKDEDDGDDDIHPPKPPKK